MWEGAPSAPTALHCLAQMMWGYVHICVKCGSECAFRGLGHSLCAKIAISRKMSPGMHVCHPTSTLRAYKKVRARQSERALHLYYSPRNNQGSRSDLDAGKEERGAGHEGGIMNMQDHFNQESKTNGKHLLQHPVVSQTVCLNLLIAEKRSEEKRGAAGKENVFTSHPNPFDARCFRVSNRVCVRLL